MDTLKRILGMSFTALVVLTLICLSPLLAIFITVLSVLGWGVLVVLVLAYGLYEIFFTSDNDAPP